MAAQDMSRKRPAPGASPVGYPQPVSQIQNNYTGNPGTQLSDDQFLQWGQSAQIPNTYQDPSATGMAASNYPPQSHVQSSNQLTRRPLNQIATLPAANNNQWYQDQKPPIPPPADSDDVEELELKAQVAKREAQAKRKQIPPFVLKLNSFLENGRNTDLIHWSEDGKSFIVSNEDEFANNLIPELFKHNNYASFVRQLNMYGFHKKVGLSDNSMRASERKSKTPSEYSNPYFRRGHPELLWLIQKPKNANVSNPKGKNRTKTEGDQTEDGDEYADEISTFDGRVRAKPQLTLGQSDQSLTQEQFQSVQRELMAIRHQQSQITRMLSALKREHDALVDQANDYQNKHSRHEHSINAILTFLATLYNRSLQNHEGASDIAKMFANTLQQDQKSNVVDVDDFVFDIPNMPSMDNNNQQPYKKQRLMITDGNQHNRASTVSPAPSNSSLPRPARKSSQLLRPSRSPPSASVEEIFDPGINNQHQPSRNTATPQGQAQPQPQQDMMSLIHNTNARNSSPHTPVPDFSNMLNDLESSNGNSPLTAAQRDNMLRMINNSTQQTGSNALMSPSQSSSAQNNFDSRLANTKADLDSLARLQAEQDKSVQNLANLLQPLSPTGSIPGIGDGQNLPPPPGLDIDDFLNHSDYFADIPSDGNGNLDFGAANNSSAPYNGPGNGGSSADMFNFNDDDELFGDMENGYNNMNGGDDFFGNENINGGTGGRVQSVASSEVTTPKHSSVEVGGDVDGNSNSPAAASRGWMPDRDDTTIKRRRYS